MTQPAPDERASADIPRAYNPADIEPRMYPVMRAVVTDIRISNVNGGEARPVEALVDTGGLPPWQTGPWQLAVGHY